MPGIAWYFVIPVLWVVAGFGLWWAIRRERRDPSSYPRTAQCEMDRWRAMSARAQEAHDNAVLDAAEAAQSGAVRSPVDGLRKRPSGAQEVMAQLYRLPLDRRP
ncbi:hypothetical protein GCM10018777_55770 [Streptomyces albogriseolus]|uniref:hypothetical protein n=1 Tax=Streptomyces TaxID=1883 RepID=UPI00167523D6|nr:MULTISPECIES: hypothetical protein [Streptomyces]GHB15099.1 hypothetical protein GCM10010330_80840 [Streptomyces tendae]GHG32696.1 hypothetical protein GCM10018777_55770 [Streptomyces viridodiastaticus]